MYPDVQLFIDGRWRDGGRPATAIVNPATEEEIGTLAHATIADLDEALAAAQKGFLVWRDTPAMTRARHLRKVAEILRSRKDEIAAIATMEEGKPLEQAQHELSSTADIFDWCAEEARRTYGRSIPPRVLGVQQIADKEPVGPVAAFTPWNFPLSQVARKVAAALAAGCSIILKAAEDTPGSAAQIVKAIEEAGVPAGVVNLVFGDPAEISSHLIASPIIRKVSFTGSTAVGKLLAAQAGQHMKRITLELGGHAPAIVFDDADIEKASSLLVGAKYRNGGQICIAPTRFLVQEQVYGNFLDRFVEKAKKIVVGDGLDPKTGMGPLVNERRVKAVEELIADAVSRGAKLATGGQRVANKGYFFEPTVLTDVPLDARAMNEEPFGPVALVSRFSAPEEAIAEANRLPYGLAAYAYTRSSARAALAAKRIESGMVSINHQGLGPVEMPFGGIKESGYGLEGGSEAIEAYLVTKMVTHDTGLVQAGSN